MKTTREKEIQRQWHLIDAQDKILGRLASHIAHLLMGKNKPYYIPYLDCGDYVVVVNTAKILLSGKKETAKKYFRHSGYPGGFRVKTAAQIRAQKPEELIRHAVVGMLPKTKMGKQMIKKLYIYPGAEHPYGDKKLITESTEEKESTESSVPSKPSVPSVITKQSGNLRKSAINQRKSN